MSVTADSPDWSPHVATAAQIAATGVPLLGNPVQLVSTSGTAAPMTGFSSGVFAVGNNIAFDLNVTAYVSPQNVSGAALASEVAVFWYADAAGTIELYKELWGFWLGNAAGAATPLHGHGPMHGPYMKVVVNNPGSSSTETISSLIVWGTSRPPIRSDWRQATPSGMSSGLTTVFPLPNVDGSDGLLMGLSGFVFGASSTLWMPMAVAAGDIWIRFNTTAAFTANPVVAMGIALTNGSLVTGTHAPGALWLANNSANAESEARIIAPRGPLYFVAGSTATSPTIDMTVTTAGPP